MENIEQIPQPGNKLTSSEQTQEDKEKMEINNTGTFQEAIEVGSLTEAAAWLEKVKSDPKYDARWLDHRSREIMQAFCDAGEMNEAARYIDYAQNEKGCQGREEKIKHLREETKTNTEN